MLPLLVNCHRCGREFRSDLRVTEAGIQGHFLEGVVYRCPHCGVRDPYFAAEHHLEVPGGFAFAPITGSGPEPVPPPRTEYRLPSRKRLGRGGIPPQNV